MPNIFDDDSDRLRAAEALAKPLVQRVLNELYKPGEQTATLSKKRVESVIESVLARQVLKLFEPDDKGGPFGFGR